MPWLIAAAAPIVTSAIGQAMSQGDKDKASALQAQGLAGIQKLQAPTADDLKVALQQYKLTGQMSPELQSIINLGPSEMAKVGTNPALMQAQMSALSKLQQMGNGGFNPQDLAALAKIQNQAAGQGQAQQASALQAMQQRGIGGGGNELAARLAAAQGASNQVSQAGMDVQSQAAQRALQAIMQSGQLGGQIRGQDFSEQSQKAQAQDLISRFNAANQQNVMGQNVGARNQAQYYNLGNAQNISNMNTGVANQQATMNAQAKQQAYMDALQKASAMYGGQQTAANQALTRAGQDQGMWSGIGQGIGTAAQGYGMQQAQSRTASMAPPPVQKSTLPEDFNAEQEDQSKKNGMYSNMYSPNGNLRA